MKRVSFYMLFCALVGMIFVSGCDFGSSDGGSGSGGIGELGQPGGFLWKPISESNGRLVILLPPQYTGKSISVHVFSSDKKPIETGAYGGVHNGGRAHYRFTRQGGAYGNNVFAVADLSDGSTVHWPIPVGSRRTTY